MYYGAAIDFPIRPSFWDWLKHVLFNMGGPRSRTRRETIRSGILGDPSVSIYFPKKKRVGLIFPDGANPLQYLGEILELRGLRDPDEAKEVYDHDLPAGILFCRSVRESEKLEDDGSFVNVGTSSVDEILKTAIILCLCNKHFYDPGHSVIWTANRLQRKLTLYSVGDFYAGD